MRYHRIAIAGLAALLATPVQAQDSRFNELMDEMLGAVGPWFSELGEMLGDLSGWHAPEFLPNGDILIRRRAPDQAPGASPESSPDSSDESAVTTPLEL